LGAKTGVVSTVAIPRSSSIHQLSPNLNNLGREGTTPSRRKPNQTLLLPCSIIVAQRINIKEMQQVKPDK